MRYVTRTVFLVVVACLTSAGTCTLTNKGLPHGQTIAPRGVDYLHYTLYRPRIVRRKKKGGKSVSPRRRLRSPPGFTLSTSSPAYTLRDSSCLHASPLAVRNDDGWVGIIHAVSGAQLTKARQMAGATRMGGRESLFVLFHGGRRCEWSRKFWPVWAVVARRVRANCLVAIDAAQDSMMNYNLMVLGFPTVMRVGADEVGETFRGNRTVEAVVEYIVRNSGMAPLESEGDGLEDDMKWLDLKKSRDSDDSALDGDVQWDGEVLDVREDKVKEDEQFNWALLGANIVCGAHVVAWVVRSMLSMRKATGHEGRERERDEGESEHED